jgi:hypothetical protein
MRKGLVKGLINGWLKVVGTGIVVIFVIRVILWLVVICF